MTDCSAITELNDYEDEDIFDVVVKLEKSFGLKFDKNAFKDVATFGDLCDVFDRYLSYEHRDDCTKQQAFYRVRKGISATLQISEDQIKPDSSLRDFFPRHHRRQKVKAFKRYIGTDVKLLTYPDWLGWIYGIGLLLSLVAFFFDWKIALSGITFFILAIRISDKLGKDLHLATVRELTEKLSRENYIDVRRTKGTINRQEISQIIIDTFSTDLDIDKAHLTRAAKFSWAK